MRFLLASRLFFICAVLSGFLPHAVAQGLTGAESRVLERSRVNEIIAPAPDIPSSSGFKVLTFRDHTGQQVGLYTASYALIIGASNYVNWPVLPGVQQDIQEIIPLLQAHGFQIELVRDPTRDVLQRAFESFIMRYGQQEDHRLVIYFAGHGHTMTLAYGAQMGYLVPVDAPYPSRDAQGFLTHALDMHQIETYARRIQAKHVLFLFDSCFAGSVFSLSRAVPATIQYKTGEPVRQFITSGSANEVVPDVSVFRQQVIAGIRGEADTDGDGYVTGTELGEFLQKRVIDYSNNAQHPQYGKLRDPHLDRGDFVFLVPPNQREELSRVQTKQTRVPGGQVQPTSLVPEARQLTPGLPSQSGEMCQQLTGTWVWMGTWGVVTVSPDGVLEWKIHAQDTQPTVMGHRSCAEAQSRRFLLHWNHGFTDTLVLSGDGQTLSGVNQHGLAIRASRLP